MTDSPKKAFFPTLDGYRALAAIAVLVLHASVISGFIFRNHAVGQYLVRLDVGVSVFFLISGFLLYRPFVLARLNGHVSPSLKRYFVGRFLRIYPAYWVALIAVVWIFKQPGPKHQINSVGEFIAYFGLFQQYFAKTAYGGIQQAWTLCVEVSFYIFLPLWAFLLRGLTRRTKNVVVIELIGLAILFTIGIAYRMLVLSFDPGNAVEISWLPAFFDQFALGMLLAVVSAGREAGKTRITWGEIAGRHPWVCWAIAALCFWVVSTQVGLPVGYTRLSSSQWLAWSLGYGLTAFFFLLPAVFGNQDKSLIRRLLCHPVLVFVGVVSFGVYLWHELFLDRFFISTGSTPFDPGANIFAVLIFAGSLSLVAAALSWSLIEKPVMKLRERWAPGALNDDAVSLDRRSLDEH